MAKHKKTLASTPKANFLNIDTIRDVRALEEMKALEEKKRDSLVAVTVGRTTFFTTNPDRYKNYDG